MQQNQFDDRWHSVLTTEALARTNEDLKCAAPDAKELLKDASQARLPGYPQGAPLQQAPLRVPTLDHTQHSLVERPEDLKCAAHPTINRGSTSLQYSADLSSTRLDEGSRPTDVISVLLVDDHALMREGLRQLLELEQDMNIIGEAVDGFDALHKIRQLRPEVVLMDISLPVIDGIAVTRQVTQEFPTIAVVMLTMYRQQQQVVQAMKSGAKGYLLKSASSREVARTIRAVYEGGMLIEPELTGAIVSEIRRLSDSADEGGRRHGRRQAHVPTAPTASLRHHPSTLSEKEVEIIRHVALGMSNKEIAEKLAYSEKTVKNYLSIIFQKLGIRDRTQAAIFALRHGLILDQEM